VGFNSGFKGSNKYKYFVCSFYCSAVVTWGRTFITLSVNEPTNSANLVIWINCGRQEKQSRAEQINYAAYNFQLHDDTWSYMEQGTERDLASEQLEVLALSTTT